MKKLILLKVHRSPSPEGIHHEADQEAGTASQEAVSALQEAVSAPQEADKPSFQPPLPIGPPPPDSPTRLQIKQEVLDDGYPDNSEYKVKIPIFDVKCKQEVVPIDPRPMCRRFARGTCTSGSACIFKHEIDLAQLRRIYKFCWDFQNKKCTRSVCKHVHATIFEEQHYYRTGYLPPSALAHQKQDVIQNNKGTSSTNVQKAKDTQDEDGKRQILSPIYESPQEDTSNKRRWEEFNVGSGNPDIVSSGPPIKKCKNCDKKEYSREMTNNKMKEKMRSLMRLKEDTEEINKKSKRLFQIIEAIVTLKTMLPGKDKENLFDELLEMVNRKIALSPGSQSH